MGFLILLDEHRRPHSHIIEGIGAYDTILPPTGIYPIYAFTTENLSQFPRLGHVYNPERGLFRLIYAKAFNIYYTMRDQEVFVLFIIDGSISLNQELADPMVTLPEL